MIASYVEATTAVTTPPHVWGNDWLHLIDSNQADKMLPLHKDDHFHKPGWKLKEKIFGWLRWVSCFCDPYVKDDVCWQNFLPAASVVTATAADLHLATGGELRSDCMRGFLHLCESINSILPSCLWLRGWKRWELKLTVSIISTV